MLDYKGTGYENLEDLYHSLLEGAYFWLVWETDDMDYFMLQINSKSRLYVGDVNNMCSMPYGWMGVR